MVTNSTRTDLLMESCTIESFVGANGVDMAVADWLMWSFAGLSSTLGNLMLFVLYHYERFGGDPAKRSLFNRLISHSVIACAVQSNMGNLLVMLIR